MNANANSFNPSNQNGPASSTGSAAGATGTGATPPTMEELMQAMLHAFQGMANQGQGSSGSPPQPIPPERGVVLTSGVGFRSGGPRHPDDIERTKVLVTRAQRQASGLASQTRVSQEASRQGLCSSSNCDSGGQVV